MSESNDRAIASSPLESREMLTLSDKVTTTSDFTEETEGQQRYWQALDVRLNTLRGDTLRLNTLRGDTLRLVNTWSTNGTLRRRNTGITSERTLADVFSTVLESDNEEEILIDIASKMEDPQPLTEDQVTKQKDAYQANRDYWRTMDIVGPVIIALPTLVASLWLMIQAKAYMKPMFELWVCICIASGEASGVLFEFYRYFSKSRHSDRTKLRRDRIVNYFFTSLVAIIFGIIMKEVHIYWSRIWIVALLPLVGGIFRIALFSNAGDTTKNLIGSFMVFIELYRLSLFGAVLEFSSYNIGLILLLLPLAYVEMMWVAALSNYFIGFQVQAWGVVTGFFGYVIQRAATCCITQEALEENITVSIEKPNEV